MFLEWDVLQLPIYGFHQTRRCSKDYSRIWCQLPH